ncbi:hypothetical protein AB7321_19635, partial [Providencia rettgeri]
IVPPMKKLLWQMTSLFSMCGSLTAYDILYTVQSGRAKDTLFKLHFTKYDNHTDIPSYGGGYGNIFQDEKDIKFMVMMPFTVF